MVARRAHNPEVAGSNPVPAPTSEQALYRLLCFFMQKIRDRSCRCSSFIAKRHARLACSFVNAFTYGSQSLPPFCEESAFGAVLYLKGSHRPLRSKLYIACSVFLFFSKKAENTFLASVIMIHSRLYL